MMLNVAVIFNSNTVKYAKPVDDPWFYAQKTMAIMDLTTGGDRTLYMSETPRRAIGCAIQVCLKRLPSPQILADSIKHQLCIQKASGDECSQLDSLPVNITSENWPKASSVQLSAL
jgi:hypothetical protein